MFWQGGILLVLYLYMLMLLYNLLISKRFLYEYEYRYFRALALLWLAAITIVYFKVIKVNMILDLRANKGAIML